MILVQVFADHDNVNTTFVARDKNSLVVLLRLLHTDGAHVQCIRVIDTLGLAGSCHLNRRAYPLVEKGEWELDVNGSLVRST